jgi:hypothetical protein
MFGISVFTKMKCGIIELSENKCIFFLMLAFVSNKHKEYALKCGATANSQLNIIALVSKTFWCAVAPENGLISMHFCVWRCVSIKEDVIAENVRKWFSVIRVAINVHAGRIIALAEQCPLLRYVNMSGCKNMNNAAIIALAENCSNLTTLNMRGCHNIGDAAINALAQNCPSLSYVCMYQCPNISNDAIHTLMAHCPLLKAHGFVVRPLAQYGHMDLSYGIGHK